MSDVFSSPKSMLRRAKHHIDDLDLQIEAFKRDKPWSHVIEKDIDGVTNVHKVKFTRILSEHLPNIVFDAANNLRSTLDQIGFAIASLKVDNPKAAKFPFGPTEVDMLNNLAGGSKDLPPEIQEVFRRFKPYKEKNEALWALNELSNRPKHKLIVPLQIGGHAKVTGAKFTNVWSLGRVGWDRDKNEFILFCLNPEAVIEGDYQLDFGFEIVFDPTQEIIGHRQPVPVLRQMGACVEQVLSVTEVECRRIGLI